MNVLVVFTYGYSFKTWENSGTISREISLYKKLHEDYNINFLFLTFGGKEDEKFNYEDQRIKILPIYTKIKVKNSKFLNYLNSFFIPFYIKKEIKDIDIVKQNQLLGSWISIIIKFLYKKPIFVITGYDMYKFSIEENKKYFVKKLYKVLTKYTLKFADLYTVTSNSDRKFLSDTFKLNKEIKIRRNWILKKEYKNYNERYKNKILSVGRLEHQKDFNYLIESFKNTQFQIDIIGEGSLKKSLMNLANQNNVNLNILNNVDNESLLDIIKNYKYFISTSSFEGNPKSLLEALSSGCVVIATDIENHKEIIKDTNYGILYSKQNNELPEIIDSLGKNKANEMLISENAYRIVNDIFSIKKIVSDEILDYQNLLIDDK